MNMSARETSSSPSDDDNDEEQQQQEQQQDEEEATAVIDGEDDNSSSSHEKDELGKKENDDERDVDELAAALEATQLLDDDKASAELRRLADWIRHGQVRNILVVAGAGISVAAGIPDFRTKGTGLYDNLSKYNLPYAEAIFDVQFYQRNPQPFVTLASELWPTGVTYKPTLTHHFLSLLAEKQLLLRVYTQNIDGLEHLAHLPESLLVECHGHFRTASCIRCGTAAPDPDVVQKIIVDEKKVPRCHACATPATDGTTTTGNGGYCKPDIVFFGESLPSRFYESLSHDLPKADACLVLGTSLRVAPVSLIPHRVSRTCKRVVLNREWVGDDVLPRRRNDKDGGVLFCPGDCDDSVQKLSQLLGWHDELQERHQRTNGGCGSSSPPAVETADAKPSTPTDGSK